MARADTGTDDQRVRVRPSKGSRPRTKRRPDYSDRPRGRVVAIDRGRFAVALEDGPVVSAVKAREIPRGALVIGDFVRLTGDLSGEPDTLARVVYVEERHAVLRRSLEEAEDGRGEKIIVANADLLVIVTAAADPEPRTGMVERCLVAAAEAGIPALLVITKTDLANPADFTARFDGFDLEVITTAEGSDQGLAEAAGRLRDRFSVLVGHSGVGKSTLINALIPGGNRAVGAVNALTGKGRHTSTSAQALPLPQGGWLVDTPGVRSFGLAHAEIPDVLGVFPGLDEVVTWCLPNCSHENDEPSCALDLWVSGSEPFDAPASSAEAEWRADLVARGRALLAGLPKPEWL